MAGRSRKEYTDDDRAAVYLALTLSTSEEYPEGNVARASRDTGIPETTIRDWRDSWSSGGVPAEVQALAESGSVDFAEAAERLRDKAMKQLSKEIPNMSGKDLVIAVGVLTDKIMRARGLASHGKVVHEHQLPSPDEVKELMGAMVSGLQSQMATRRAEIVEVERAEPAEFKALPPARS